MLLVSEKSMNDRCTGASTNGPVAGMCSLPVIVTLVPRLLGQDDRAHPMTGWLMNGLTDRLVPVEVRRACVPSKRADAPFGQWNRFVVTLRGDRVTVVLNGERVIDQAPLPKVPARGPLGLQNHGDPIEFRNLFIKELK